MANPEDFASQYAPLATRVGDQLGVSPDLLLSQWGLETGWGKSVIPGTNNLGNIMDFSGGGVAAVDNYTGRTDKYRAFETPEAFGEHFVDLIRRRYPSVVGSGSDPVKFATALKQGGYAEHPEYVNSLVDTAQSFRNRPKAMGFLAGATNSDANPPTMSNNPFASLNEEFRLGVPEPTQQANPFDTLNTEFALPKSEPYVAPPAPTPQTSSVMGNIQAIPRMLGLTGRAAIEGVGSALSAPTEPWRMAIEAASTAAGGPRVASAETMAGKLANLLQLPKPVEKSVMDRTGQAERFGFDVAKTGFSAIPMMGGAKLLAPYTGGNAQTILQQLAANPAMQGISAAGAGAGGSVAREYGSPPEVELLASILGGVAAPIAAAPIQSGIRSAVTAAGSKVAPTRFGVQPEQIDELITSSLGRSGFDFSKVPDQIKTALRNDVGNALRTGGKFDEDAMRRLFDIRMIEGATPTKGMITLDPRQVTLEQNLAKTGINSTNTDLQQLAQIQNTNNQALINALNQRGAGKTDLFAAGQANIGNISAADAARQAATSSLYKQAEGMPGGQLPLNRNELVQNIDAALVKANKNAFLPAEVRTMINSISKGETTIEGVKYPVPFDVNALDNLMTTIATAQRSTNDGNIKAALKVVRDAIDQTEIKPIKTEFGGGQVVTEAGAAYLTGKDAQPKELLDALNKARASHRERMTWQESSAPVEAAVSGMQPDNFVKRFVLSGTLDDAAAIAKSGDPVATKNAILTHLKSKALGGQSDEIGSFGAKSFNSALDNIGDRKLALFFTSEEIGELKRLGRVASYMTTQPKGSAVNNSNSGALVLGAGIDALGALGGLPFVGTAVGATAAVPLIKAGAKKVFGSQISQMDQKEALNMANALATRVPSMELGEKVTTGLRYGSLLQNPDLMQQLGQRFKQLTE